MCLDLNASHLFVSCRKILSRPVWLLFVVMTPLWLSHLIVLAQLKLPSVSLSSSLWFELVSKSETSWVYSANQHPTRERMRSGTSLVGFCESILIIHFVLFWIVIDKHVYLHSDVSFSGLSNSGTSGQVRWFRNTTVTWEQSTPSPLSMRIVGLSARQMTRASEFGSGKFEILMYYVSEGIWVCFFMHLLLCLQAKHIIHLPSTEWLIMEDCGCTGQQLRETHQLWTRNKENSYSLFSHPSRYSVIHRACSMIQAVWMLCM